MAEEQTSGRGQPGKSWHSPRGGLYFSVILKPRKNPDDLLPFTRLSAQAVASALPIKTTLKPPNDLLVDGKKICGILIEKSGQSLIAGIGLNVNIGSFAPGLQATSLQLETGKPWDLDALFERIMIELKKEYLKFVSGKV